MLSPGALYLLRTIPNAALPIIVLNGSFYLLKIISNFSVHQSLRWTAYIAVNPLLFFLKVAWTSWRQKREAARMGAVQVPVLRGRWLGNYDVVKEIDHFWDTGYIAEPFWPIREKLGNIFNIRFVWTDTLFTTEPDHVKQVLSTEFHNFEKGPQFINAAHSVLGVGVFNSDGEMWKFHRSMTRPFFSRERIDHFDLFERHADAALELMVQRFRAGHALDAQDVFARFTLDSATDFLFGHCVHALRAGLPYAYNAQIKDSGKRKKCEADEFARALWEALVSMEKRTRLGPFWPLWEMWRDNTTEPMTVVHAFLDPIIAAALQKKHESEVAGAGSTDKTNTIEKSSFEDEETLLDHLVKLTDDPIILKDETLNILIAGRDTTAATLTLVTYLLSLHPEVLQQLRAEILEKVGATRRPTYDNIREMKYLRAVINETLRLYPAVPYDDRQSINATTFSNSTPGGKPWYVPARTNVTYSVFMMHRRTDLWGPDAMEFDPNRFLDERLNKYLLPNPFIFLPFNAGPRICLGQQFAYNEVSFMLVRLLQTFDAIELATDAQPPNTRPPPEWKNVPGRQATERFFPKTHLTMYSYGGLWVRMREAKD